MQSSAAKYNFHNNLQKSKAKKGKDQSQMNVYLDQEGNTKR